MSIFDQLSAPFATVHWRAQTINRDGTSAMALAYIDARDVMTRLDAVVGPDNWRDSYTETAKGRLLCTLELRIGGEWIGKSDGAGDTDVEGDKGAISDALKRTAVKWGIGRYLYDLEAPWAECESSERNGKKHWKKWTPAGLRKLQAAAGSARALPPAVEPRIDDAQWAELVTLIEQTRTDTAALCAHYKVGSLRELTPPAFENARARLSARLSQKEAA